MDTCIPIISKIYKKSNTYEYNFDLFMLEMLTLLNNNGFKQIIWRSKEGKTGGKFIIIENPEDFNIEYDYIN